MFRSYAGRTLVPLDGMRREQPINTPLPPPASAPLQPEREIDATFLHATSDATVTASNYYPLYPLLEYPGISNPSGKSAAMVGEWRRRRRRRPPRNPYFAYRAYRRLDNADHALERVCHLADDRVFRGDPGAPATIRSGP